MTMTKREHEEMAGSHIWPLRIARAFVPVLRLFMCVGVLRRAIGRTASSRIGTAAHFLGVGEHEKARAVALGWLRENRVPSREGFPMSPADYWWDFLELAATSLLHTNDEEAWQEVLELAENGRRQRVPCDIAKALDDRR